MGTPLSEELRQALGMSEGAPPPWLVNMQRYGPPPSYPGLQIPGLTAPIPEGAAYGYHAGGWGKPPVDDSGNPLYGNAFGTAQEASVAAVPEEMRAPWGAQRRARSKNMTLQRPPAVSSVRARA